MSNGQANPLKVQHWCFAVSNLDSAVEFYRNAFGYEVTDQWRPYETINGYLGIPNAAGDIVQLKSPISDQILELIEFKNVPSEQSDRGPTRPGAAHISFEIPDMDTAIKNLTALGGGLVGDVVVHTSGSIGAYVREPGGSVIELNQPARFAKSSP